MRKLTKILLGVLVALLILNTVYTVRNIHQEIRIHYKDFLHQTKITDKLIINIYEKIDKLEKEQNKMDEDVAATLEMQSMRITMIPQTIKANKILLEKKLQQINVIIVNKTMETSGSGVTIKYKGKFYILSVAHMVQGKDDEIILIENGNEICQLEIVKWTPLPEQDKNFDITIITDLILLRPKNKDIVPKYYVELADREPIKGTEIYIIGNPMGIEDVISEGRVAIYKNNVMYYRDDTYYGNSGGGIYSKEGKLLGIVSHMYPLQPNPFVPPYMLYGAVRLSIIYKFLEDVN